MKQKRVAIIGNGDIDWLKRYDLEDYVYIIGVDRAAYAILKLGIIANCAIGDFDSVTQRELKEMKQQVKDVREYPADKDKTDLELAVSVAIKHKPSEIAIYGGTGGRLDHEIAALYLLRELQKKKIRALLRDKYNEIRLIEGKERIEKRNNFTYLSILPYSDEITVSISGCKYPLAHYCMEKGKTLGLSNVITAPYAEITLHKGISYVIVSRDKEIQNGRD